MTTAGAEMAVKGPMLTLIDLIGRARKAESAAELRFLLVNDTHALAAYRQSALWFSDVGLQALSGVVQVEANAPYALWLNKLFQFCSATLPDGGTVAAQALPEELAAEWEEWLPSEVFWLPLPKGKGSDPLAPGGLLLARDIPWTQQEALMLNEWAEAWRHAWHAFHGGRAGFSLKRVSHWFSSKLGAAQPTAPQPNRPWWRRQSIYWVAGLMALAALPVRLTVLAPGELVPFKPDIVRAPLDGVVDTFHVQPNQRVKQGQALFGFDEALIRSRLKVARQALSTAETEYRQAVQQSLMDPRARSTLTILTGKIEEKRTEANFVADQLQRAQVLSPREGVVLFDDPAEWIGRPVMLGERIMRVAAPEDIEVEVWLGLADAIPLHSDAQVTVYLNASPLDPVHARLRYVSHDAMQRPDGSYAYRMRATLTQQTLHRVGLKGTARVEGELVPFAYWVIRRPWANVRSLLGW
jgi:hypothetical protein